MVSHHLFALLVLWCWSSLLVTIQALPDGAAGCAGNGPAVGGPHLDNPTTGTLGDGSITVLLDGQLLIPGVDTYFLTGQDHTLTLEQSSSGFKGLLFRLDGVGTSALSPLDATTLNPPTQTSGDLVQICSYCTDMSVSGVTHTSNLIKSEANVKLRFDTPALNLPLDVTVVIRNDGTSEFYYSQFTLNAVETMPTAAPVLPPRPPTASAQAEPTDPPQTIVPTIKSTNAHRSQPHEETRDHDRSPRIPTYRSPAPSKIPGPPTPQPIPPTPPRTPNPRRKRKNSD